MALGKDQVDKTLSVYFTAYHSYLKFISELFLALLQNSLLLLTVQIMQTEIN